MPIKTTQRSVLDLRIPGLLHAYNFDTLRDDVTGAIGTLSGPPPRTSTVAGIGRYCTGGNYVSWPITPAVGTIPSSQQGKGVTVFVQLVPVSLISYGAIFRKTTSAFSLSISIHSNGLVNYRGINGSTANWPAGTKYPLAIGKMSTIAYCASGTADRIYVDGKQDGVGVVAAASQSEGTIAFGLGGGGYSASDIKYIRAFVFDRELSGAEVSKLHSLLVEQPQSRIWVGFAGASAADLVGSATGQAAATGSLTTQIPLAGAATEVSTASGALTTQIPLSGAAASLAVSSGVLTTTIALSGAALAQVVASAALSGGAAALSGATTSSASATADLTTQITLSGTAVAQAIAAAGLTTSPSGLAGSAAAIASSSGALSTGIPLVGQASALAISAGGLTTGIPLAGAAVSVSIASGELTVSSGFSASALMQAAASGTLSTQVRLNVAAVAQAVATGILSSGALVPVADPRYTASMIAPDRTFTATARHWHAVIQ